MHQIYETEPHSSNIAHNNFMGFFPLFINPEPAGVARIELQFDIDANSQLLVVATDLASGEKRELMVDNRGGMLGSDLVGCPSTLVLVKLGAADQ